MATTGTTRFIGGGDTVEPQELVRVYAAKNGFYAKTALGSVVVGASMSDLFASLQGILAEEVLRAEQNRNTEQDRERERSFLLAEIKNQMLNSMFTMPMPTVDTVKVMLESDADEHSNWIKKALRLFK